MEYTKTLKIIALEIEEKLGSNHLSTILHKKKPATKEHQTITLPQLVIIVKKFDKYTIMILSNILREYPDMMKVPIIVEFNDLQGMLDSIPKVIVDIKRNYEVLAGQDSMEMVKPPSYEHFRAQTELTLRSDIVNLRRDLLRVMSHQMNSQEYLKQLSIIILNSIRIYYLIVKPDLGTTEEFITQFNEDFPMGRNPLQKLLNLAYSMLKGFDISEEDKLQLILSAMNNILQPILIETDALGIEFNKSAGKETEKLSYDDFIKKYHDEIRRLQEAMDKEFIRKAQKREYIVRGELELKFRKREKDITEKFEDMLDNQKKDFEKELRTWQDKFDDELEKQTTDFVTQEIVAREDKLKEEYESNLKKIKEELEFKYITSDLQDKEEKLRREFKGYEKTLRESYTLREKELLKSLDLKEQNFKDALELEYKGKMEEEKDLIRKNLERKMKEAMERDIKFQARKFDSELIRREKMLEKAFKRDFDRKEKDMQRVFKRELHIRESELTTKLQLNFEREKLKMESKKSDAFLKLIEKELSLKSKELEKYQFDRLNIQELREMYPVFQKTIPPTPSGSSVTRNFMHPPESSEESEDDLFSKILNDNRTLQRGLRKKGVKKVS